MVTRRSSEALPPQIPIAPIVKRKRRASCLGEQERRERKRAIDREAQRSLREKTKTHIAELERTIQVLRDQDRNGATANLLSEIEGLRTENERLRNVIHSVKSVIGGEIFPQAAEINESGGGSGHSSAASSFGPQSPRQPPTSICVTQSDTEPPLSLPSPPSSHSSSVNAFEFRSPVPATSGTVDLDGMTVMSRKVATPTDPSLDMELDLHSVEEYERGDMLDRPDSPTTAVFAPFLYECFGPNWRCPSPVILHIGNPDAAEVLASSSLSCPIWKKSNELFGKVFSYRPGTALLHLRRDDRAEAGMLYHGIKDGWDSFDEWMQSPALEILKTVDEHLFYKLPKMERLAVAYKSFRLLKYYLDGTKENLEKVPGWLRPSFSQALDFFAWPTLRSRLLSTHHSIFRTQDFSKCYSHYLRFNWPLSFEDAFYYDETARAWIPGPLFERYHGDLRYWGVSDELYKKFPEMEGDIEGDRRRYAKEMC